MIKKAMLCSALLLFLILSIIYITPSPRRPVSGSVSTALKQKSETEEGRTTTVFLDEQGIVTTALDLGYSTKTVTKTQGGTMEAFYAPDGNPVRCSLGYYAVLREEEKDRSCIRITYLDENGKPVMLPLGYAGEEEQYNADGWKESVRFFDTEWNPVCSLLEGYGKRYEKDTEGRIGKIIYMDLSGEPMMTGYGYAMVTRTFYHTDGPENGQIENEFYFDTQGQPVRLQLGQYGIHRGYSPTGEGTTVTYLDAEGNPAATVKGYTTVDRSFHDQSYQVKYYDEDGNPYSLSEGQYGIKKQNGQTDFLNSDGKELLNIRHLFNNHPTLIIVAALLAVILSSLTGRRLNTMLLILFLGVLMYFTLMYRETSQARTVLPPMNQYGQILFNQATRSGILKNIWLFIPLGAVLYRLYPSRKALLIPVALSVFIELVQYFTGIGWCEADDVISNGLGGLIGYETARLITELKNKRSINP